MKFFKMLDALKVGMVGCAVLLLTAACAGSAPTPQPTQTPVPTATAAPTATPEPTPTIAPTPDAYTGVPAIVDHTNHGWPRQVKGINGLVTIKAQPTRILTLSLGHDETAYALVPAQRIVAVGAFTKDPGSSNVADLAKGAATVARDPEQIIDQNPDLVIASGATKADLVKALSNAGITVVQTDLDNSPEKRVQNILLFAYMLGEEARGIALAKEVTGRQQALLAAISGRPAPRQRVVSATSYSDSIYAAGSGSTEGFIIVAAGGINAAAEAGVVRNQVISLEGLLKMQPDTIVITQPADSGEPFRKKLLENAALADVPAIKQKRVYVVSPRYYTTLSFWNLRGAEDLAQMLWPEALGQKVFGPFSFPK